MMSVVAIVLQVLLGLAFLMAGGQKLIGVKDQVEAFVHYRYPQWFRSVTGAVEVLGAIGIFVGLWVHAVAGLSGLLLIATMIGAIFTHVVRAKDPLQRIVPSTVLLVLALIVLLARWPDVTHLLG